MKLKKKTFYWSHRELRAKKNRREIVFSLLFSRKLYLQSTKSYQLGTQSQSILWVHSTNASATLSNDVMIKLNWTVGDESVEGVLKYGNRTSNCSILTIHSKSVSLWICAQLCLVTFVFCFTYSSTATFVVCTAVRRYAPFKCLKPWHFICAFNIEFKRTFSFSLCHLSPSFRLQVVVPIYNLICFLNVI